MGQSKIPTDKEQAAKKIQARVVQCCVESGLLFEAHIRTWKNSELKYLQSWIDRCYRHVWSSKSRPPLIELQEKGVNMLDIRNQLNIKSIRWKIEGRTLRQLGRVMRMDDKRLTKIACLGWLNDLQTLTKCPGKKTNTNLLA